MGKLSKLSTNLPYLQHQTQWASQLNPVLTNPFVAGLQLTGIELVASTPLAINHLLSRQMQGWTIVDQDAFASIMRTKPFNDKTITLESNADVTISLWVY